MEDLDHVARYAISLGYRVSPRTVLVEGTSDAEMFAFAAHLAFKKTGVRLIGDDFAVIAAGERDRGGTRGVIRELHCFRGFARTCLEPDGRPRYRFAALFDNDNAGKQAVRAAPALDPGIVEFKDTFRLWPIMAIPANSDSLSLQRSVENANAPYKGLDWELEDLFAGDLIDAFKEEHPSAVARESTIGGRTHRDFTADGKARLHRFVKQHALLEDVSEIIDVLKALRHYMGLRDR